MYLAVAKILESKLAPHQRHINMSQVQVRLPRRKAPPVAMLGRKPTCRWTGSCTPTHLGESTSKMRLKVDLPAAWNSMALPLAAVMMLWM